MVPLNASRSVLNVCSPFTEVLEVLVFREKTCAHLAASSFSYTEEKPSPLRVPVPLYAKDPSQRTVLV